MTPLEACQAELADAKTPAPDFLGEDLTPAAILLYMFEASKVALTAVTAGAASLAEAQDEEQPVMTEVLNGVSFALAGYMHALVVLGVLPKEAEEAISSGATTSQPS